MRKLLQLALALSLVGGVLGVQGTARADHCETSIYVFSSRMLAEVDGTRLFTPSYASNRLGCQDQDAHFNSNWIYPWADSISVRFLENVGEDFLLGKANGLGLEDVEFELRQDVDITGAPATYYDSQRLPVDLSEGGELVVEIYIPIRDIDGNVIDIDVETETYRTMDQDL